MPPLLDKRPILCYTVMEYRFTNTEVFLHMNATPATVRERYRAPRFSLPRVLLCGVLLSVLVAACLYIYHTSVPFLQERLLASEKKVLAWMVKELGFYLPLITVCLFHAVVYHKHDRRDGVAQREMMWEILVVLTLTYAVLLPHVSAVSRELYELAVEEGATIPETDVGVPWTLMMKLREWFLRQPIALGLLLLFHATRARREIRHPETEAEDAAEPPAPMSEAPVLPEEVTHEA